MITLAEFAYRNYFPSLSDPQIQASIDYIDSAWSGVEGLWSNLAMAKRELRIKAMQNLLVAWHLSDMNMEATEGIVANGGIPLQSKDIGGSSAGTKLAFRSLNEQDAMIALSSNPFGIKALQMFNGSPDRYRIYG